MANEDLTVALSSDQALVLFDWLGRLTEDDGTRVDDDEAALHVLWWIENSLEGQLVEVFAPDYRQVVQAARRRLVEVNGGKTPGMEPARERADRPAGSSAPSTGPSSPAG